jgi:hypothetical protein
MRTRRCSTTSTRDASTPAALRRALHVLALGVVTAVAACSSDRVRVAAGTVDQSMLARFKTFSVTAPTPPANRVAGAATNDTNRVAGAVMDMDPMLATSLVGRAMRQDLTEAFVQRGYQSVDASPDFYVAYYAGMGKVVDTRIAQSQYHVDGKKISTETYEYPAGTIVVDVVDARSDSLAWRGTGIARIPDNPDEYSRAIRAAINQIVAQFPTPNR